MSIRHRYTVIAVWLLLILACLWLVLARTSVTTDLDPFLPAGEDDAGLLNALQAGPVQRLILAGIAGGTESQRAEASRALAERLRGHRFFRRVANGASGLTESEQRLLFERRYLLSAQAETPGAFHADALRKELRQRLEELRSPLPPIDADTLAADPTGALRDVLARWRQDARAETRRGLWFSPDGERALLMLETRAAGFDLDDQVQAVATIEAAFEQITTDLDLRLALSGPAVFAADAQETIRAEVTLLSAAATAVAAMLLLLAFRSKRVLVLGLLPLASAMLAAAAVCSLLFGELYGITLGFGVTLLGVTIDYPLHLFGHRRPAETPVGTLARIWPVLRLGVASTALGYLAMIATDLRGLQQLGLFAVVGLLAAAAVTRWLLPALLPVDWVPRQYAAGTWSKRLPLPPRWLRIALPVAGGLLTALALATAPRIWNDDPAVLSPIPDDLLRVDRELRLALGAPEADQLAVVAAPDPQTALRRSEAMAGELEALQRNNAIGGYELATQYLPSTKTQQRRQAQLPTREDLQAALRQAQEGLEFKSDAFAPFVEAVQQARRAAPLTLQDLQGTTYGARVEALLLEHGGRWLALAPLSQVVDAGAVARRLAEHPRTRYVDLAAATKARVEEFRTQALSRLAVGGGLIALLLWRALRDPRRLAAVILPVLLAVGLTVAALLALGRPLTLFHLVSLLLVFGLGIDYSLFFSEPHQDADARRRTLYTIGVCVLSTTVVFGMLALSSIPVLQAIGLTVVLGGGIGFASALLLARTRSLPASRSAL